MSFNQIACLSLLQKDFDNRKRKLLKKRKENTVFTNFRIKRKKKNFCLYGLSQGL